MGNNQLNISFVDKILKWGINRLLQYGVQLLEKRRENFSFEIDGYKFSKVRPLLKSGGSFLNKAGCLSWLALLDGKRVKIYECHSDSHAEFIKNVTNLPLLKLYFPNCLMRIGSFLVADWIKGKPVTRPDLRNNKKLLCRIAKIQALFHTFPIETFKLHSDFDYLVYLKNRLNKYIGILPISEEIKILFSDIDCTACFIDKHLSHPDITAVNLIIEDKTDILKIIDNELLIQDNYFLIDLFNTHYSLGNNVKTEHLFSYLKAYIGNGGDISPLMENQKFYCSVWKIRILGSMLESGSLKQAFALAKSSNTIKHPLINLIEEGFINVF